MKEFSGSFWIDSYPKQMASFSQGPTFTNTIEPISNLLDGATSQSPALDVELGNEMIQSIQTENLLEKRLQSFRNIIDLEIGDTPLTRARNIEREYNIRNLYLKFEGSNPTGTHKDRIAFAQVQDALRRGYDSMTLATCGNYGVATSLACYLAGLKCNVYIPVGYHTNRIKEMQHYGAKIFFAGSDYEEACQISKEKALLEETYDANPGGANSNLQMEAYAQIAYEIYDELRDAPAAVAVPVSNGTALAGIYLGFVSLYRRAKTSRIPKMIAGSSYKKNPIVESFLRKNTKCLDLQPTKIYETAINEPLINWHSSDGQYALDALYQSNGFGAYTTDRSLMTAKRMLRNKEGMLVLPAATAGFCAFINQHQQTPFVGDRYVVVITGK